METPKVSVCMPVYNRIKYLKESVDSILKQTFTDFEFLIIDDGSTDNLTEILGQYDDPRIRYVRNEINLGISGARNKGLKLAMGEYIAFMDSDDISLPHRLELQVSFMDSHPEVDVCGTWTETFGNGKAVWKQPAGHGDIFAGMIFECTLFQPVAIMRKKTVADLNVTYREKFLNASDYDYWGRLGLAGAKFANISEVCLRYRLHDGQISKGKKAGQNRENSDEIRMFLLNRLGLYPSEHEFGLHMMLKFGQTSDKSVVSDISVWIDKIREANKGKKVFPEDALDRVTGKKWFRLCRNSSASGLGVWNTYRKNAASKNVSLSIEQKMKFFTKSLLRLGSKRDLLRFTKTKHLL